MKPIKVFFNGKRLRDIYPHATWIQVIMYRIRKFIRKSIIIGIPALIIGLWLAPYLTHTIYVTQAEPILVDNLTAKVTEIKNKALDDLKKCESQGHKEEDGIIIFDSNNVPSIGLYQFQRKTVIHYYKVLYGKDITAKDSVEIALDESKARELARDIIFTTEKGYTDWTNCSKKIGMLNTLSIIKTLEN